MHMIRCYAVVEERDVEIPQPLTEKFPGACSAFLKFQYEVPVMASMCDVIGVTRDNVSFSTRHQTRIPESQFILRLEKDIKNKR